MLLTDLENSYNQFKVFFVFILSLIFFILVDQAIKLVIENKIALSTGFILIPKTLRITYLRNFGAAFGILINKRIFLIITTLAILVFFIWFLVKFKIRRFYYLFAFSTLISGGIGNLIDRIFRGYVVDYIDLIFWPFQDFAIFNLADILTMLGCSLLFLKILFSNSDFEHFLNKLLNKNVNK